MPTIMCTRNLWRAMGGREKLAVRTPESPVDTKLSACINDMLPFPRKAQRRVPLLGTAEVLALLVVGGFAAPMFVAPSHRGGPLLFPIEVEVHDDRMPAVSIWPSTEA